ncbi:MAG TPA: hypothetical protein VLE23_13955 [Geminicoccaceae bacterium]|nr:hypothetical protein [Geminicoccaceae bacterium]
MRFLVAAIIGCALGLNGAAGRATTLLAEPLEPGANLPPTGRSLFDELFEVGPPAASRLNARYALPYPFERLLAELNGRLAPGAATTVLIPLGRSLQRHAAEPDYFASPRVVVAVTDDRGAPNRPLLRDRLYLGYHERAEVIEAISYNEVAGRFEFQLVEGYGPDGAPQVTYGERFVCVACHQAHGPIFPTAVWNETSADPRVAAKLADLGVSFHGAPTRGGVDRADAVDRSTDRAAWLPFANALWADGCGGAVVPVATRCRGDLLLAALRYRLGGARSAPVPTDVASAALAERLAEHMTRLAPAGLGAPSPDLPNRAPLAEIEAGVPVAAAIEPDGVFEPSLRRAPLLFWQPSKPAAELLATAVRNTAAGFADGDILWLDRLLAARAAGAPDLVRERIGCRVRSIERDQGRRELRLTCGEDTDSRATLAGYILFEGDVPMGGLIDSLSLPGHGPLTRLIVVGGGPAAGGDALELQLREAGLGLSGRLASGERLASVALHIAQDGAAAIDLGVVDDLEPLRAAVRLMVQAASTDPAAALGVGPLRRRAVLAALAAALDTE